MRTYGNVIRRIFGTLLLITVRTLASGAAISTKATTDNARPAAISTIDPLATDFARVPLDLRPPDLQSIPAQLTPQAARRASADEPPYISIVGTPVQPQERLNLMRTGIGSIYWAAGHPAQAWKVLLPIVPNDGSAVSEDFKAACANVLPLGDNAVCP